MIGHLLKILILLVFLAFLGVASLWFTETCYKTQKPCTIADQNIETVTSSINSILKKVQ